MEIERHKITIREKEKIVSETLTRSAKETERLAEAFAKTRSGGEVIALAGNLGSGKTTFAKGLARALGVKETITSPTFVLMNVYEARRKPIRTFVHIDCYRLEISAEFAGIGASEYFLDPQSIVAIEWPERIKALLPKETIWIEFETV